MKRPALEPRRNVLIKLDEVSRRTCMSRSEIYRRLAAGTFPASVQVGARAVAFVESEVDDWITERIAERDKF